jgi:hypothetical protein
VPTFRGDHSVCGAAPGRIECVPSKHPIFIALPSVFWCFCGNLQCLLIGLGDTDMTAGMASGEVQRLARASMENVASQQPPVPRPVPPLEGPDGDL